MAYTLPIHFLGLIVAGDIGDRTIWTDKYGRKVISNKNWPDKPASVAQLIQRTRWKKMCLNWRQLDDTSRQQWEEMSRLAWAPATGFNLFAHESLVAESGNVDTLRRQTGVSPPKATYIEPEPPGYGQFF